MLTVMSHAKAGGPGDSKEDVKWLDEKLFEILGDSSLSSTLQKTRLDG